MNNLLCRRFFPAAACVLLAIGGVAAQTSLPLSFGDALRQMQNGNRSLKIADKGIEAARAERDKLNALWYPSLQGAGTFVHLSEKIEVKQPLSQFTDPAKDFVHNIVPDDQFISSILDQIGSHTLAFPLAPRNLTSVGLTAEWVVFSGGKRIRASKIGNTMIDIARENRGQTDATQRTLLAESYFGLKLAQEVVRVRQETYNSLQRHYQNALKLEAAGMIDKAGRLFAQVNMDEAARSLEAARKEASVVQSALRTLLNLQDTCSIHPTSELFINNQLPAKEEFLQAMRVENYTVNQLQLQSQIARQQLRIDQSGYLPDIAVFGKQTLYAHGIQSNLVPRTIVGVGFTWNLFDGLAREAHPPVEDSPADPCPGTRKSQRRPERRHRQAIHPTAKGTRQRTRPEYHHRAERRAGANPQEILCRRHGNQYRGRRCGNDAGNRPRGASGSLLRI